MPWTDSVYTVTVLDVYSDPVLGIRRTPAIFTRFKDAVFAVHNNLNDIADHGQYQYAVIEETVLNLIYPSHTRHTTCWWYKYNSALDEFEPTAAPAQFRTLNGFGIG